MTQRIARHLEPILATLLGIAAIATAFAAFQSSQKGDIMNEKLAEASATTAVAFSRITDGSLQQNRDEQLWIEYKGAERGDDPDFAEYLRTQMMSDNMRKAVRDAEDPDSETLSPTASPKYVNEPLADAEKMGAEADAHVAAAHAADDVGDRYDLATVILAVALFFFGIAAVLKATGTRLALTGGGTVILIVSLVLIATAA